MLKHQLLKKAYDNYPKGTIIDVYPEEVMVSGKYSIVDTGVICDETKYNVYNSITNTWAEINVNLQKSLSKECNHVWIVNLRRFTGKESKLLYICGICLKEKILEGDGELYGPFK